MRNFPAFDIFNITRRNIRGLFIEAAGGAGAGSGGDGGAGGAGGAAPVTTPATGSDGKSASSATPGSAAASSTAGGNGAGDDGNIAQLRSSYDTMKKVWEPASALGKPEEVIGHAQTMTKLATETKSLGKQLGYSDSSVAKAFKDDPVNTLAWLRNELKQKGGAAAGGGGNANANADVHKLVEEAVAKATAPYTEKVNKQEAEAAMKLIDNEFLSLHKASFPADGNNPLPDEMSNVFFDAMQMLMDTDPECYKRIREGKTSDIKKYYDEAKSILLKMHTAWNTWEQKKVGLVDAGGGNGGGNGDGKGGDKDLTLDDIINARPNAVKSLKSMQK